MSVFTHRLSRFSLRQIIAICLISVMIALLAPAPSAAAVLHTTDQSVRAAGTRVWTWFASALSALGSRTGQGESREQKGVRPLAPPTKAEREAQVAAIELNVTSEIVLTSRQPLLLTAIPLDQEGRPIHGIRAKWESSDKRVIFVRKNGEAVAGQPGRSYDHRAGGQQVRNSSRNSGGRDERTVWR
jgi:hypothetical protein